jgi:uncharacterized membrane protein
VIVNLIANIIGALGAIVFVGYFAYTLAKPPLIVIVVACLALMVYSLFDDMRNERKVARARNNKN